VLYILLPIKKTIREINIILLKEVIASDTVDSYVEKFLLEDGIKFKWLSAERLNKLKRYLEMFSEL